MPTLQGVALNRRVNDRLVLAPPSCFIIDKWHLPWFLAFLTSSSTYNISEIHKAHLRRAAETAMTRDIIWICDIQQLYKMGQII